MGRLKNKIPSRVRWQTSRHEMNIKIVLKEKIKQKAEMIFKLWSENVN